MQNWLNHVSDSGCMYNRLIQVWDKGVVCKTGSFRCGIRGCMYNWLTQLWDKGVVCKTGSHSCGIRGLYVKLAHSVVG